MVPDWRLRGHQPGLESAQPAVAPFLFPIVPRRQTKRAPAWGALWINWQSALLLAHLGEALAAVDGTVGLGLERHPSLAAAGSAHSGEILTGAAGGILAGVTAGLAALGLVLEAALGVARTPAALKDSLTRDQFRLYQLIWKRFTASRMQPARYETTAVKIGAGEYCFTVSTAKVAFDGFRSVYTEADEEKEESNVLVGNLTMDSVLTRDSFDPKQHYTQPPAHYTEATLVKTLEELGIGRPSTYAPTISIILGRRYVTKEAKNLYITEIGEVVNNMMKQSFPSIVDVNFTANMEGLLDMVEEGKVEIPTS